jgi:membrane-associated protein
MFDIAAWIEAFGLAAALFIMGAIVFAESGLLIGVLLPGDTLLIAAGILSAQGHAPLALVVAVVTVAAVLGDNVGYFFGKKTGPKLFRKKDGLFFRRSYAKRAEVFFKGYGGKTVLFARFIPYIRTFTPIVAGVGRMERRIFVVYNIIGAFMWAAITVMLGYWLGGRLPDVGAYITPALGIGALFVFAPTIWHFVGIARNRKRVAALISPAPKSGTRSAPGNARPKRAGR